MNQNGNKIIIGLERFAKHLKVSKPTVSMYIKMGMPANIIGGKWHFHLDLVDQWFKKKCLTNYQGETDPEEIETKNN